MLTHTRFLSGTDPIEQFDSPSYNNQRHAKSSVTGLVAATNETIDGIARHVMPAQSERALNKFLGEFVWGQDLVYSYYTDETTAFRSPSPDEAHAAGRHLTRRRTVSLRWPVGAIYRGAADD